MSFALKNSAHHSTEASKILSKPYYPSVEMVNRLLEVRSGHTDSQVGIWKTTDLQKNC